MEKNKYIVYKVVRINDWGAFISCGLPISSKYVIHYKVGEKVLPHDGTKGIFCFDQKWQAQKFITYQGPFQNEFYILESETTAKPIKRKWRSAIGGNVDKQIYDFWQGWKYHQTRNPKGTVLVKNLTPIRKLWFA